MASPLDEKAPNVVSALIPAADDDVLSDADDGQDASVVDIAADAAAAAMLEASSDGTGGAWPSELSLAADRAPLIETMELGGTEEVGAVSGASIRDGVVAARKLRVFVTTWNLHGSLPSPEHLVALLPRSRFHIYAVGTQECERGIAASMVRPSKAEWEKVLVGHFGAEYAMLRCHSLAATHLAVFVHASILPLISGLASEAVATGVKTGISSRLSINGGNHSNLGNKGGVGISFNVGETSFLFVTCHLAAGHSKVEQRNRHFRRINDELALFPARPRRVEVEPRCATDWTTASGYPQCFPAAAEATAAAVAATAAAPALTDAPAVTPLKSKHARSASAPGQLQSLIAEEESGTAPASPLRADVAAQLKALEFERRDSIAATLAAAAELQASKAKQKRPSSISRGKSSAKVVPVGGAGGGAGTGSGVAALRSKEKKKFGDSVIERFDQVWWFGDMNYRIDGTRAMVTSLLDSNWHEVLRSNDQLVRCMERGEIPGAPHLVEGPLHFKPTYKLDCHSLAYDTGPKQRIPAWTDRVLFRPTKGSTLLSYAACAKVRISDHNAVVAAFDVAFEPRDARLHAVAGAGAGGSGSGNGESVSQVCAVS